MFGDAFEQVRSHYVERPNDAMLVQTAVNGMLADLEDSYFIDPQSLNRRRLHRPALRHRIRQYRRRLYDAGRPRHGGDAD